MSVHRGLISIWRWARSYQVRGDAADVTFLQTENGPSSKTGLKVMQGYQTDKTTQHYLFIFIHTKYHWTCMGRSYFMNTQIKIAVMMIVHVCKGIYIEKSISKHLNTPLFNLFSNTNQTWFFIEIDCNSSINRIPKTYISVTHTLIWRNWNRTNMLYCCWKVRFLDENTYTDFYHRYYNWKWQITVSHHN